MTKKITTGLFAALLASPIFAHIAHGVERPGEAGPESVEGLIGLLEQVLVWFETIFWIAAVFFVIWAAFTYLTAGGDDDKVKAASKRFLYAIVAVAVAVFARVLPFFVQNFLGGN